MRVFVSICLLLVVAVSNVLAGELQMKKVVPIPAIPLPSPCSGCRLSKVSVSVEANIDGECVPLEKITESTCSGCCYSSAKYNPFVDYYPKCTCCAPSCFSQTGVLSRCSDETERVVPYSVATQCGCHACGSKPVGPSYPNILTATCDDSMRVWIDGVEQTHNTVGVDGWSTVTRYEYSDCAKVIAIQCTDVANVAMGLLASTSTGVVTDGSWKCYGNYGSNPPVASGWEQIGFNEAGWSAATVYGPNTAATSPWSVVAGIPNTANWIGYGSRYNVGGTGPDIYCRKTL